MQTKYLIRLDDACPTMNCQLWGKMEDLLDKYGIEYHVVKTYPNGVRVGYVPWHKKPDKQKGIVFSRCL